MINRRNYKKSGSISAPFLLHSEDQSSLTASNLHYLPRSYYPEFNNKPHNGIKETPKIKEVPETASNSWKNEVDILPEVTPEYEIFIDLQRSPEKRIRIEEIPRLPDPLDPPKISPSEDRAERMKKIPPCATGILRGKCENGHLWGRVNLCNKEFCPDCGAKNSYVHRQRVARWMDKVLQMSSVGYMVITIPEDLRETFKDKKILSEFRTYFKRKLQREGFKRGMSRYHWAGECESCNGKPDKGCPDCNFTGMSNVWKPHLNFILEGKYISPDNLERWREDLANYFNTRFALSLSKKAEGNIYYNYGRNNGYKIHKLKYVTRATWRYNDTYEYGDILNVIKGFRCGSTWGKFEISKRKRVSPLIHFVNNCCPICKTTIKWKGFSSIENYFMGRYNLFHVEGGYYKYQQIGEDPPPPPPLDPPQYLDPIAVPETLIPQPELIF